LVLKKKRCKEHRLTHKYKGHDKISSKGAKKKIRTRKKQSWVGKTRKRFAQEAEEAPQDKRGVRRAKKR